MMAFADLRQELNCSICLSFYTDPVMLRCGHNFCKDCIRRALDTQERSGFYFCPECRGTFNKRPALQRNLQLRNIVERFLPTHPVQNKTGIFCTYCVHSPVPAVKTCLHCEASLCDTHLKKHNKSVEHVLTEPTTSLENRKCPIHKEILKYYCSEDGAYICVSCCLVGEHRGHQVELLNEASEKKKETLRDVLDKLKSKRQETEKRVQGLQERRREVRGKSADITQRVTALFKDIREQLEALEKRVLSEISRQEEQVSLQVSGLIQQLEIKKDELSWNIRHIEELCNTTDPLSVLREDQEYTDTCDMDSDGDNNECIQLDEAPISLILHRGLVHLSDVLIDLKTKTQFPMLKTSDISLDINTANYLIDVSSDLKAASFSLTKSRPHGPQRFNSEQQVLSISNFSSGRHYWEVDVSESEEWCIGVTYPSIERKIAGKESSFGYNDKSWALRFRTISLNSDLAALHNNIQIDLHSDFPVRSVGIYLNYEAGRLSFYQLCDPVRHVHTFTATFTEPLHAAFGVYDFHFLLLVPKMASAELRKELNCSICLSIYTDPVTLRCGHNFCKDCIRRVLDTQERSGVYSCPECRKRFTERPALQRNIKLCNIVERFLPTHPDQEETGIFCTYCDSQTPAVKTCLQCEASLCDTHLKKHSKSVEHVLIEPTTSLENRKCPIHKELLKYYCSEDGSCICVSCCLVGEHRGHQVELLNEASEKKKETLRDVLEKLKSKREETEKRVQGLPERRREVRGKSAAETQRVTALIRDIREQLEALEKRVLSEISRQEEQVSLQVSGLIQQLEIKKDELSRKIRHIEELCNKTDPLSVLREDQEYTDTCVMDSDGDNDEFIQLDEAPISLILHRGLVHLSDVLIDLKLRSFPILETSDISLDMKTADNYIIVSSDLKSATYTSTYQRRPDGPERFKSKQVLSISNFSSGRHYWEVDVSDADKWLIGVAYPSIERKIAGNAFFIGYNDKSWALTFNGHLAAFHNNIQIGLYSDFPVRSVGIYLNYEAGHLSFYQLCDPVRHLHTFTATFNEPLHAAFYLFKDTSIRMASADLREELNCSVCMSIYTDPVTLQCGHNFCLVCINRTWDNQEERRYSCPECRLRFRKRPELKRNLILCNIVERLLSTPPVQNLNRTQTCLENRKCPIHEKILKYYCPEDGACVCASCCLVGEHRGHQVELLNEASEKKKETLRNVLDKLKSKREETEKRVQSLKERRREVSGKSAAETERVTALIRDIREQLEALEKRVLSEISRQEEQVSLQVSGLIQQLEIKKDELSRKIRHIEEVCTKTDPLSVLREDQEYTDTCDMDSDGDNDECIQLDEAPISLILHRGLVHLSDVLIDLKLRPFPILVTSDMSLDMKTAGNYIIVSSDLKSATYTSTFQKRPDGPERFKSKKVLSISNFSSGRHYWEVDVSEAEEWCIGVAYPSIERKIAGHESFIGGNDKSWALIFNPYLAAFHNNIRNKLYSDFPVRSVGIYLNYEAGRLSFYQLCDPVRHLHTFTATFTEPLHAAFYVYNDTSIRIRESWITRRHCPLNSLNLKHWKLTMWNSPPCTCAARCAFHFHLLIPRMASADLREELTCSICLKVYTDPVTLRCGHNFCKVCIRRALDTQERSGVYSCPECRKRFTERPALQRNIKLRNIVELFLGTHPDQNKTRIFCSYCVNSPVPAVKSCLRCEVSLCDIHLWLHKKSEKHVLIEPTTSIENKKCPIHKELLKYHCPKDGACICVSCCLVGEHRGHQVELLNETSEKRKKETLRDALKKLKSKREETEKRVQCLQERRREVRGKSSAETQRVTALIRDIREQLEALEKRVLSEISRQEEEVSLQVSGLIQQLEIKKDELSRKIRHIEELCNKTDPLSVLREDQEYTDTCDMDSDGDNDECIQLDEAPISLILHRGLVHLSDVLIKLKLRPLPILVTSDISMDMKTAGNYIIVSSDLKSATYTSTYQRRPDGPERFKSKQVQTISNFSSGRHYWEVDVSEADKWLIGVAYPSIERKIAGNESFIGYNDKSWGLTFNGHLAAFHNNIQIGLYSDSPVRSVGIYLNYEAGRLSFYQLCDPVRHLHTYTATFTEPLHAAFYMFPNTCIRISHLLYTISSGEEYKLVNKSAPLEQERMSGVKGAGDAEAKPTIQNVGAASSAEAPPLIMVEV
ncbi:uncharacterized protein WCC33_014199 [Rhinophrynus dorsalis]